MINIYGVVGLLPVGVTIAYIKLERNICCVMRTKLENRGNFFLVVWFFKKERILKMFLKENEFKKFFSKINLNEFVNFIKIQQKLFVLSKNNKNFKKHSLQMYERIY